MFHTVLVANRGEIALRVMRTLHALGIRAAAVFSDADERARHVVEADVAVRLGPAPASESYLHRERVLDAAVEVGADALHPGYGFLAEDPVLAEACAERGITFIGPLPSAIRTMGDKISARAAVAAAGVPIVDGIGAPGMSDEDLCRLARDLSFPVLVKPSAGGGGKAMHIVHDPNDLSAAIARSRREARRAFGDDTVLIERFIPRPRHIEVQIAADAHGNTVHIGERECSIQRRHQKILEEAPSPLVSNEMREAMGARAVAVATACGYVNLGTVEFIASGEPPHNFFFIEMNTRLQVEHAVTELVYGVDLVEAQVRIAAGERLPWKQEELRPAGHAVEVRIYAEDTAREFLPTGGTVHLLREPRGARVDSSLVEGTSVTSDYDPMLAKVITQAETRHEAIRRLDRALAETAVLGVTTNIAFLRRLLTDEAVLAGELDTGFVDARPDLLDGGEPPEEISVAARIAAGRSAEGNGAWSRLTAWRHGGATTPAHVWLSPRRLRLGTRAYDVYVDRHIAWVGFEGEAWKVPLGRGWLDRQPPTITSEHACVVSPMPGTIVAISVTEGDTVAEDETIAVIEAMKMEHVLRSPTSGVVTAVHVSLGAHVTNEQPIVDIEASQDAI